MRSKVGLVVLFLLISGPVVAQWSPIDPFGNYDTTLGSRIHAAMLAIYNKTFTYEQHGVVASVIVPGLPQWNGAVGTEDDANPMAPDYYFEIGECTKTFVATLILQLEDSGKLSIRDPIYKYLPSYPNVDPGITIKQLLEHSSGTYDYIHDDPANTLLIDAYFANQSKRWTVDEILQNYVKTRVFTAGADYKFSNTDYLLLGLIAEKVTGNALSAEIHRRFLAPLGLTHTLCCWSDSLPTGFAHNYTAAPDEFTPSNDYFGTDKSAQLTMANAAAGMVSTPSDLAKWADALYSWKFLSHQALAEMLAFNKWTDGSYYGLGAARIGFSTKAFYGHEGSLPGFHTMLISNPSDSITVALYMNSDMDSTDMNCSNFARAIVNQIYSPNATVRAPSSSTKNAAFVYPNPVSETTCITFDQNISGEAFFTLYDVMGHQVRMLRDASGTVGHHSLTLLRGDLAAGAYHYVLNWPEGTRSGNLVIE